MAASARSVWKGQLRLSLVSIPVELYSATASKAKISLRQIHAPTGKPIKYEKTVPGVGPVDPDEIIRGYEIEKGEFVQLEEEELDEVKLETRRTIELAQFVGACDIDPIYFDKPYYVVPQDELAEDAYRVVRDALRRSDKMGLGQMAIRGKEYLVAVKPCASGLLLETLHYEEEIRKTDSFFGGISDEPADEDLLAVAEQLIERKTAPFDAAAFKDNYTAELRALIERKAKGRKPKRPEAEAPETGRGDNVVDLMAALKQSLESDTGGSGKKAGGAKGASGGQNRAAAAKTAQDKKTAEPKRAGSSRAKGGGQKAKTRKAS
jgi:DNA end-binding protein Ku